MRSELVKAHMWSTRGSLSASSRRPANQDHKPQTQFRLRTDEHNDTVIDRNESSVTWIQSKLRSAAVSCVPARTRQQRLANIFDSHADSSSWFCNIIWTFPLDVFSEIISFRYDLDGCVDVFISIIVKTEGCNDENNLQPWIFVARENVFCSGHFRANKANARKTVGENYGLLNM